MPKKREYTNEERQSVVTWHTAGKSFREIEVLTGIDHSTCCRIVQKWEAENNVKNRKRSGRKKKFTPAVVKEIEKIIKADDEMVATEIRDKLVNKFGNQFATGERHIRNIRKNLGFTASKGVGQDELTDEHKKGRVQYCKRHKNDQFSNVIFTDEKPWVLGKRRRKKWRKRGGVRRTYKKTKYPLKLQCWAGISLRGLTDIVIWKGRQKTPHYIETLEKALIPFAQKAMPKRWRMLHDRDTTHTARRTEEWCDANIPITLLLPAKSPDLNPIEKIWDTLEQKVYKHKPKNEKELKKWIRKEWKEIDTEIVRNSTVDMIKQLPLITAAEGEYVESKRGFRP
jgi:transposase